MFKNTFIELCNQKGVSPTSVCLSIGLSNAAYSNWTDKTIPRDATLQKIADYFGVTVDYLLGKTEKPADEGELVSDYNVTEKTLIEYFRQLDESDRFKVIQYTMNLCTEVEKKPSAKAT